MARVRAGFGSSFDLPTESGPLLDRAQAAFGVHPQNAVVLTHGNLRLKFDFIIRGYNARRLRSSKALFRARAIWSAALLARFAFSSFALLAAAAASSAALLAAFVRSSAAWLAACVAAGSCGGFIGSPFCNRRHRGRHNGEHVVFLFRLPERMEHSIDRVAVLPVKTVFGLLGKFGV